MKKIISLFLILILALSITGNIAYAAGDGPYVVTTGFPTSWEMENRNITITAMENGAPISRMTVNNTDVSPSVIPELSGKYYLIKQIEYNETEKSIVFNVLVKGDNFLGGMISLKYDTSTLEPVSTQSVITDGTELNTVFSPLNGCGLITSRPSTDRNGGANIDLTNGTMFCTWTAPMAQKGLDATSQEIAVMEFTFKLKNDLTITNLGKNTLSVLTDEQALALKTTESGVATLISKTGNQAYTLSDGQVSVGFDYQNSLRPGQSQFVYTENTANETNFMVKIWDTNGGIFEKEFIAKVDANAPSRANATVESTENSITVKNIYAEDIGDSGTDKYIIHLKKQNELLDSKEINALDGAEGITFNGLQEGTEYKVYVYAKDVAGNMGAEYSHTISTKSRAPQLSIVFSGGVQNGEWYSVAPTITISSTDSAQIQWRTSESSWTAYTTPFTVAGPFNGTVQAKADNNGNVGTAERVLKIDSTRPTVSTPVVDRPTEMLPFKAVTFDVIDDTSGVNQVQVTHNSTQTTRVVASQTNQYTYTADRDGAYTITAVDNAGNSTTRTFVVSGIISSGSLKLNLNLGGLIKVGPMEKVNVKAVVTNSSGAAGEIRIGSDMPVSGSFFGGAMSIAPSLVGDKYGNIEISLSLPAGTYNVKVLAAGYTGYETTKAVGLFETQVVNVNFANNGAEGGKMVAGDIVSDGVIDKLDLKQAIRFFNKENQGGCDINRDGVVDITDIARIIRNMIIK